MTIVAIVPAYNEAATVAAVVQTLVQSGAFSDVVVVDDGSVDMTSEIALASGARVVRTDRNRGKGGAMLYALGQVGGDYSHVAFFDADLLGLRVDHVARLIDGIRLGYDMVCGLRDKGIVQNVLQLAFSPVITGERILARWIIDALPKSCWSGYSIETAMNFVTKRDGGKTALVFFDGVSIRTKVQKKGFIKGVAGHLRMANEIGQTRQALRASKGMACRS